METLIQRTLEEWSADARIPADLADRALRHRTRRRVRAVALATASAVASAALVAAAVTADIGSAPPPAVRPTPADTNLHADPRNSPPQRLVAAGRVAMSAYYITNRSSSTGPFQRTWYLYDPASGGYRRTPWAYLDVAPGLRKAAVLEGPLPAARVGLLDMTTQKVVRWIPLAHRAAGLAWSPDGRRLLVTTYEQSPDVAARPGASTRTGFYLVTVGSGRAEFRSFPADKDTLNSRQDLGWSRDGTLIWSPTDTVPTKKFYDLRGRPQPAPPHEAETYAWEAGLSPNGRLISGGNPYVRRAGRPAPHVPAGKAAGPATSVRDVMTGKVVGVQPVEQLLAWTDDTHLIALTCRPHKCTGKGEFYNRLVLVDVRGKDITPLTGYRHSDRPGSWTPVFTRR